MRLRWPAWTASLTWKALAFLTVICCLLAFFLGALVHVSVTHQTVEQAREKVLDKLERASEAYEAGEALPRGAGLDLPGLPSALRDLALQGKQGSQVGNDLEGRPRMWAARPADGRALAVAMDYRQSVETITGLDRAIIGSSVLAIGATLLVGAFAVTRVTRRLHQTARVARRIGAGDLDARVNDPRNRDPARHQDEVSTVSGALDTMAGTLQGKLLSEQRFTADVAHELRTPLTGLTAAAELLPPGRPSELVRDRVATLRRLTEDLLEISRLDSGNERLQLDVHPLGPLAERAVRGTGATGTADPASAPGTAPATEVRIVRDAHVETDRRRLERVLGNLVANAHKHGRAPVLLTVEGPVVTVRDHGDGYPAYLVEHGPQRFRTEAGGSKGGHGLGLTIALGQAEAIGARLTFHNAPGGGAVATLALPEYGGSTTCPVESRPEKSNTK
ncbi:sensor histidine kinase [Streptomyces candidus]|uniref:histidine kinase n=1 Tax=Streptomyces candidus TaxID=67283 RepID=A0A7X0LS17_9ACTN|nr:HAMP domain-containing sensor histidine kinase [Streptomyces candidus]MBB6437566.1 signal transduction histidine kinase [Streptomyces candidus]GHH53801.1 two-component sensor histidine kinase [Streptomyces candidus]